MAELEANWPEVEKAFTEQVKPLSFFGRADIILSKLVEVYGDEKTGYGDGWTDKRIAEHLGVPRAWVAKLREENFGPEGNEEIRTTVAEAEALLTEIRKIGAAAEPIVAQIKALLTKAEHIDKSLLQIKKDLR